MKVSSDGEEWELVEQLVLTLDRKKAGIDAWSAWTVTQKSTVAPFVTPTTAEQS